MLWAQAHLSYLWAFEGYCRLVIASSKGRGTEPHWQLSGGMRRNSQLYKHKKRAKEKRGKGEEINFFESVSVLCLVPTVLMCMWLMCATRCILPSQPAQAAKAASVANESQWRMNPCTSPAQQFQGWVRIAPRTAALKRHSNSTPVSDHTDNTEGLPQWPPQTQTGLERKYRL